MSTTTVNIDLAALEQEINALTPEEIASQLLKVRTKQRVQQKKYQNTDAAKAYRKKRAETIKAVAEKAKTLPSSDPKYKNLYEQIQAQAADAADQVLGETQAEEQEELETV